MIRALLFIILITVTSSCNETNPRTIKAWIAIADTIVIRQTLAIQDSITDLCNQRKEAYYTSAYDSIYQKRMEEMNTLLDSIKTTDATH